MQPNIQGFRVSSWDKIKYFEPSEFDSPDLDGSGSRMQPEFIKRLDAARDWVEKTYNNPERNVHFDHRVVFNITSGYRTKSYNKTLRNSSPNSSHLKGWAADIAVKDDYERLIIDDALRLVGFTRIGIGSGFIHVDSDPDKNSHRMWTYYKKPNLIQKVKALFNV